MKIIGIFGGSGAGKSTTGKLLNQLLDNSLLISLDPFMLKYADEHASELCKKFGITINPKHFLNFMACRGNSNKCWIDEIKKYIENDVYAIIDCFSDQDYIILDWAFLPYSDLLFNLCDETILVESDHELKYRRVKAKIEKEGKIDHWNEEQIRARIDNTKDDCQGAIPTYTIINDNTHSLSDQLIGITEAITNKKR